MSPTLAAGKFGKVDPHHLAEFVAIDQAKILPEMIATGAGGGDDVGDP
jgi:hypothetical protein